MWENLEHAFLHAAKDTLPLLPWLVLIYIVIELLENKTSLAGNNRLGGKLGPLIGSATGLIPQCGFSVMAAKLFEQKYQIIDGMGQAIRDLGIAVEKTNNTLSNAIDESMSAFK